ncbi:MAG: glycosyltransferase family 2 protein [Phycisphaerae bacterium]
MTDKLNITAVLPAYNCSANIARALESVLAQSRRPDEVIVVNDGSTDNTAEIVRSFGEDVRLIEQANAGASAARNAGIKEAKGEWIAFLDSDDEWLPAHLETQEQIILRNPNLVWSAANHINFLESENRRFPYASIEKSRALLAGKEYHESYFHAFRSLASGWTGTMLVKKDVLIECGLFRLEQKIANDLDMWFRIAHRYPEIGYSPEPAAVYHLDTNGISSRLCTVDEFADLLERHLAHSIEAGSVDDFAEHIGWQVPAWVRACLFDERACDARRLALRFKPYIPKKKFALIMALTVFPRFTMHSLRGLSKIVRLTGLRKRAIRPPKKL